MADRGRYDKHKFRVIRNSTGKQVEEETFTLIPEHDAWARPALLAYARACERQAPSLARSLRRMARLAPRRNP